MATETQQTMSAAQSNTSVVTRAAEQIRQFICGLHGHDVLLHFEQKRMSLQCTSCGYETPGWDLRSTRQPQSSSVNQSTPVVRMPLVHERRVA